MLWEQLTHLQLPPGHTLCWAPLRCEQKAGCGPKLITSGGSSPFLIQTTLIGFILFSYCFNEPLVIWYGKAARPHRKQTVGKNSRSGLQPAPHPSQGSLRSCGLGGLLRDLRISLGHQVGYSWAKSMREQEVNMKNVPAALTLFFYPHYQMFSYFNLFRLHFFKSREQTMYCSDSVLNSGILWVMVAANPFLTVFQLQEPMNNFPLPAMHYYTNFVPNFNLNIMVGVKDDSSPKKRAAF